MDLNQEKGVLKPPREEEEKEEKEDEPEGPKKSVQFEEDVDVLASGADSLTFD